MTRLLYPLRTILRSAFSPADGMTADVEQWSERAHSQPKNVETDLVVTFSNSLLSSAT